MSTEATRAIIAEMMQDLDQRNLDAVVNRCAPDARFHGFAPTTLDVNGYRESMRALLDAFPDSRFPVDDIVAESGKASCRHSLKGTHGNAFQGIPASGRSVTVPAIAVIHSTDGLVTEIWLNADFMGMMQQIGAIPAAEVN